MKVCFLFVFMFCIVIDWCMLYIVLLYIISVFGVYFFFGSWCLVLGVVLYIVFSARYSIVWYFTVME